MKQIKTWLISASAPICGTDTYYRAYSKVNPELLNNWYEGVCMNIIQELWDNYSWGLHLEDEEYDSEEEEDEAYEQAWEDWKRDCNINNIEIIYDERERDLSKSSS